MRPNLLKEKWRRNEPTIGTWLDLGSPLVAEALARLGFDWLLVDLEHSVTDLETAQAMLQGISCTDAVPLVRVPWNEPSVPKRVLDAGAYGIIFPMVNSREEAQRAVAACKYPPQGMRSCGPMRAQLYGGRDYLEHANEEIAVILLIEHRDAVERIDDILGVPGIDALYIGPYDLAMSLGVPPGKPHPELEAAVSAINKAGERHQIVRGIMCDTPEDAKLRLQQGFRMVGISTDLSLLLRSALQVRRAMRSP